MSISDSTSNELWRGILGYEGIYQASNLGQIRSLARRDSNGNRLQEKLLKSGKHTLGYRTVVLCKNGVPRSFLVHFLVLLAFVGQRPERLVINHKNGDKSDNRLENLEYCSQQQNLAHARDILHIRPHTGRDQHGEKNNGAKLTEADVRNIKAQLALGTACSDIAKQRHLSGSAIENIKNGKSWVHVN